jgi:hypothetical protein
MKIDGRCHCGFLSYVAEVDPEKVGICHCTDCQTLSSTAFRVTVPAEPGTLKLTGGEPTTYVKIAESGRERVQAFCPKCGTAIYAASEGPQGLERISLRVGAMLQRAELTPKTQHWARSKQAWVDGIGALPARDK